MQRRGPLISDRACLHLDLALAPAPVLLSRRPHTTSRIDSTAGAPSVACLCSVAGLLVRRGRRLKGALSILPSTCWLDSKPADPEGPKCASPCSALLAEAALRSGAHSGKVAVQPRGGVRGWTTGAKGLPGGSKVLPKASTGLPAAAPRAACKAGLRECFEAGLPQSV